MQYPSKMTLAALFSLCIVGPAFAGDPVPGIDVSLEQGKIAGKKSSGNKTRRPSPKARKKIRKGVKTPTQSIAVKEEGVN